MMKGPFYYIRKTYSFSYKHDLKFVLSKIIDPHSNEMIRPFQSYIIFQFTRPLLEEK